MSVLTKTNIASRLLIEAIRLFYDQRDIVAIHTLVASAHQILFDLCKVKGFPGLLKNTAGMRREEVQEYLRLVNYPYNFFKHADRDVEARIHIDPLERFSQDFIMDAVIMLQTFAGELPFEAKVFWMWFVAKYPEGFDNLPEDSEIRRLQAVGVGGMDFRTIATYLRMWCIATEGDLKADPTGYGAENL